MNNNSRLDETIKKALSNYESSYNSTDWTQMESMLDAVPHQNTLTKSRFPLFVFALAIVVAAFIFYKVFQSDDDIKKTEKISPHPITPPKPKTVIAKTVETPTLAVNSNKSIVEKELNPSLEVDSAMSKKSSTSDETTEKKTVKKVLKKEVTPEIKKEAQKVESDTVRIDDGNDSNRKRLIKSITEPIKIVLPDTIKSVNGNNTESKKSKRSRKEKRANRNDSIPNETPPAGTINPNILNKN